VDLTSFEELNFLPYKKIHENYKKYYNEIYSRFKKVRCFKTLYIKKQVHDGFASALKTYASKKKCYDEM
jgi:hypothetical protein